MAFSLSDSSMRAAANAAMRVGQTVASSRRSPAMSGNVTQQVARQVEALATMAGVDSSVVQASRVLSSGNPISAVQSVLGQIAGQAQLSRTIGSSSTPYRALDPLQGALARPDPLMSYNWFCQMPTLNFANSASINWNYVEAATLPFRNYSTSSIYRDGKQHNFVQMYGIDNLSVTFYLDQANVALSYLTAWDSIISPYVGRQNLVSQGATYYLPSVYAKDIIFFLLDATKQQVVSITYVGCYPLNIGTLGLTSGTSDALTADVQFNVNDIAIEVFSVERGIFNALQRQVSGSTQQAPNIGVPRPVAFEG